MLLKSVAYHNFRPFIGNQKIDLTITEKEGKNVIVLLGNNTFGKSTFVLSFIWCLYGESRFSKADDILNKKIENSMPINSSEDAFVEVVFEDDGKLYTMRRTQTFIKNEKGVLRSDQSEAILTYVDVNGETKKAGSSQYEIDNVIKSILPLDLSSFFFFEGEKTNEIKKKDLGLSVRTLLGLEAYDKMRSHLFGAMSQSTPSVSSVMGDYQKKQKDVSGNAAKEAYDKIEEADTGITECEAEKKDVEDQINKYESLIESVNEKLRQAEPSKELQLRRDEIELAIRDHSAKLSKKNKQLLSVFSKDSLPLLVTPLLDKASAKLERMKISDKGIKGIEVSAIHELLARKECLCGCDLFEGTAQYKNVAKYIDYVPPRALGTLVRDMKDTINEKSEENKDFADSFEELYKEILGHRTELHRLENEDKECLDRIKGIDLFDTLNAEQDLDRYKKQQSDLRDKKEVLISKISAFEADKKNAQKDFEFYKSKDEKAKEYQGYYKYAEAIFDWVNSNYVAKEKELRERLNDYISDLFNKMYSGRREIEIDDKYNIKMTVHGSVVDDTGGLRVIEYFSYVGGLVKLAYEVMKSREADNDNQSLGEQYPLVLDAAFSHADADHTRSIARELSNASSQLVFALMRKDWEYAKEGLSGKVAKIYELEKIDETEVHIKEVVR